MRREGNQKQLRSLTTNHCLKGRGSGKLEEKENVLRITKEH